MRFVKSNQIKSTMQLPHTPCIKKNLNCLGTQQWQHGSNLVVCTVLLSLQAEVITLLNIILNFSNKTFAKSKN